MKQIFFFLLLLFLSGLEQVQGRQLDYYLTLLDNHPRVQVVLEQKKALHYQAEGVMGLPDPAVFLGVENVPVSDPSFDQFLPSSKVIAVSQSIPNRRGRESQKNILLFSAANTQLEAEYTKSRLHALFYTRIAELQKVKQQTVYEGKKRQIIERLQEYYDGQIVAGEPMYQKTFATEIETAEVEQRLNLLEAEKTFIEADLIQMTGEVPEIEEFGFSEKEWNGDLQRLYPVQLASRNRDVEQAGVVFAERKYLPDFGVVASYKLREEGAGDSFDGEDWFSLQFRMTIPIWASKNQLPKLEAAKSRKKSADHGYREAVRKWQMETTRLEGDKRASSMNLKVLQKKDRALQEKIEVMERTYSAGQTSLEPVLQAELAGLSLLSQIAGERARFIRISQELNAHIEQRGRDDKS